jgi:hypothetical protein
MDAFMAKLPDPSLEGKPEWIRHYKTTSKDPWNILE